MMENRIQSGYIANLKVYEGIMNGYIWRLKERLEEIDPGCQLLNHRIPAMPAKQENVIPSKTEVATEDGSGLLSDVVNSIP